MVRYGAMRCVGRRRGRRSVDPIDAGCVSANEPGRAVAVFDVSGSMQMVGDKPDHHRERDDQHPLSVSRSDHRLDFDRPLWDSDRGGKSGAVAG